MCVRFLNPTHTIGFDMKGKEKDGGLGITVYTSKYALGVCQDYHPNLLLKQKETKP